jgi:hypothetical protein
MGVIAYLKLTTEHVLRTRATGGGVLQITFFFPLCLLLPVRALLCGFIILELMRPSIAEIDIVIKLRVRSTPQICFVN